MKKFVSIILVLLFTIPVLASNTFASTVYKQDGFCFTVDKGVATITDYMGSDTDLVIPERLQGYKVVAIAEEAFTQKDSLVSVTMPDTITELPTNCFSFCENLKKVTLPENTAELPVFLFQECSSLQEFTFPENVTVIPFGCFAGCTSLTEMIIPDTIKEIQDAAFLRCSELKKLYIPESVSVINEYDYLFKGLNSIEELIVHPDSPVLTVIDNTLYSKDMKTLIVSLMNNENKEFIVPEGVETINAGAFINRSYEKIVLPETVKCIKHEAFQSCSELKEVILPSSLEKMGSFIFMNCSSLQEVAIPDKIEILYAYSFFNCTSLKKVTLSENLKEIYTSFTNCTSLTEVYIPDNVTFLNSDAFEGCTSLTDFRVSENNKTYSTDGISLFNKDKTSILRHIINKGSEYTIPDTVTEINYGAFHECSYLTKINLPDGLKTIDSSGFSYSGITEITIPDTVTEIKDGAFSNCENLKKVVLPSGITSIPEDMFAGCLNLTEIEIPENVNYIKSWAFNGCSALNKITLPKNLVAIEMGAFYYCSALKDVYYNNTAKKWREDVIIEEGNTPLSKAIMHYTEKQPETTEPVTQTTTEPTTATVPKKTTVTLAKASANLYVRAKTQVKVTVKNGKGSTAYKSNNTKIAKVDSKGKITALKAGTAKITVTNNKVSKVFTVKVQNPKLSKSAISISKGKAVTIKIIGKIKGINNSYKNTKIAKVISPKSATALKIKGLKKGKTTLQIKVSGVTLKVKVTVK